MSNWGSRIARVFIAVSIMSMKYALTWLVTFLTGGFNESNVYVVLTAVFGCNPSQRAKWRGMRRFILKICLIVQALQSLPFLYDCV